MKILHIISTLGMGGAEKLLADALPKLKKTCGIEVCVLVLSISDDQWSKTLIESGISVHFLTEKSAYKLGNILKIRSFLKENNFDIVHAHLFPVQYFVPLSLLGSKNKPKLIFTEHSTDNGRRKLKFLRPLEKFIYKQYDIITSISEKTEEKLLEWLKIKSKPSGKFVVIPNGVDVLQIQKSKPYKSSDLIADINKDCFLISMVGRFTPHKDQDTLIKAMCEVPERVHLILVGDGPRRFELETLAKELKLEKRVHFFGIRLDVASILKTVDVVVLSSHWEGFGLAAVEGMAAQKPVLGTDVSGLREVIGDSDMLFPVGATKILAEKIKTLLENDELYQTKANSAEKRSNEFSIEVMIEKFIALYDLVYGKK